MNTRTNRCNKHLSIVINESYKTLESLTWKLLDQDNKFVRVCCEETINGIRWCISSNHVMRPGDTGCLGYTKNQDPEIFTATL